VIAAIPGTPAPGGTVRLMARGLEGAKAGYRVNWSSRQGCFTASRTTTPLATWIAPRMSGKHEIRAAVTLADGKMLEGRGLINVVGEPVIRRRVELEKVMGYLAYRGEEPLRTQAVAFDEEGNTYFLDAKLRCVLRLGRGGGTRAAASRKVCADARLREPRALAVRKGKIYILDGDRPYVKVFAGDNPAIAMGEGVKMGDPTDLAVDGRGFTYVVDRKNRCFHVFNTTGSYLHQRGARGKEQLGHFEEPVAIDTAPDGALFVLDRERRDIQVFDPAYSVIAKINVRVRRGNELMDLAVAPDGKSVHVLEGPRGIVACYSIHNEVIYYPPESEARSPRPPPKAMKMAADRLGRVYVVGRSREGVFRYAGAGRFAGSFAADKASKVLGIAVNDAGHVAILDKKSPHVRLYDPEGWLVARFGHSATAPAPYPLPKHIAMLRRGAMVATLGQSAGSAFDTPKAIPSLHIFNARGRAVRAVGPRGTQPGQFMDPVDLDSDRAGNVYALDKDLFRISIYSALGAGQTPERERAISRGSRQPREMLVPNRIAADPDTGHLYVYDDKTRLIKKFTKDMDYIGMTGTEFGFRDVVRIKVGHMGFLWVLDRKLRELKRIDFRGNEPKSSLEIPLRDTVRDAIDFGLDASGRIYVLTAKDLVYVFR
jgi:DNA-binding beta-propeller fold protein YncE